ncbi:MAG TPA: hypothetical protein PLN24_09590, partial [Victivallales bacterium]|nr:hypothetical protein [Victivallales bacterium]
FQIYLKSEFLDYVYLQQNTFDEIDGANDEKRQKRVFSKVVNTLKKDYKFSAKDEARKFFQELRQLFIDWNYIAMDDEKFTEMEKKIDSKIKEKADNAQSI